MDRFCHRRNLGMLAVLGLCMPLALDAATPVSGNAYDGGAGGPWTLAGSPYLVTGGDVTVPAGKTLTIQPGVVVKFPYGGNDILVEGTLTAAGGAAAPIVFTADRDDTAGGDSNGDGGASVPGKGWWGCLRFKAASTGSLLDYVEVRYGGNAVAGALWVDGGQLTLTNSVLRDSISSGIRIETSQPTLTGNTYRNNGRAAVAMNLAANPAIVGATVSGNQINGLALDAGTLVGNGFWDDPAIVYVFYGDITVPVGATLTLAAGQTVKAGYGTVDLIVEGTLTADGSAAAPIIFTADLDDTAGGDSNGDGSASVPGKGWWGCLRFKAASTGSLLDYVEVRYGGNAAAGALWVDGGQLTLTNSTISRSSNNGVRIVDSNPTLTDNRFERNDWSAVAMDLASNPDIHGVTVVNNSVNGLTLDTGVLPADGVWDDPDITYRMPGDVTVPPGVTLRVAAGQVVKTPYGANDLIVQGTLLAGGTAAAPIVFTSDRDDSVGGDTNNNAAADWPGAGIWGGLSFTATSVGGVLEHVQVCYGGGGTDASVLLDGAALAVRDVVVTLSSTGGLRARNGASLDVENAVITDNGGSGISVTAGAVATVFNSTLDRNSTGVHADAATAVVSNCLVTRNSSSGIQRVGTASVTVRTCDVYNPTAGNGNYRDMTSQTGLNGNVSADPRYVGTGALPYRLQDGSPAIDAGSSEGAPIRDFLSLLRYDHPSIPNAEPGLRGGVDLGAFEYGGLAPLDIDLVTRLVVGPATGTQNGTVRVTWQVTNTGTADATQTWYDAVYLSTDTTWSADDRLVGTLQHRGGLLANNSYSAALDVLLQGVVPGSFYFLVIADARHETLEGGPHDNNAAPAAGTIAFTMSQLTLGVPRPGSFAAGGEWQYYQVIVPSGANLLVKLDDADDVGLNELYLSRGTPPTIGSAQLSATGGADQMIALPASAAGAWYILVYNAFGTGAYTLLAETTHLGLYSVTPNTLGNAASLVLTLAGAGFGPTTEVRLLSAAGADYAGTAEVDSTSRLTATFAAGSVPAGVYSLRVTNPGTGEAASLANAFTALAGGEAHFTAELTVPNGIGYHQLATVYVSYRNTGTLAMPAPLLLVTALQRTGGVDRRAALLTLDQQRLAQGFWTSAVPDGFAHSVHFLAAGASPGILHPGESGRVPVYYAGWLQPWDFAYPPIRFSLSWVTADNTQAADWATLKGMLQPTGVEPGAWDAVWANFSGATGSTWGDFVRQLGGESARLARLGRQVTAVDGLLGAQLLQAEGVGPVPYLNAGVDIGRSTQGPPLVFARLLPNSISCRWRLGPLGRGWCHNWEISASRAADGTVNVIRNGFQLERYQPDSRGGYLSEPGNTAVLSARGDGGLTLILPAGSRIIFTASGALAAVEDRSGNRISATFSSGRLTQLDHSAGYRFTLTYNAAGRITRVADADGEFAAFTYDAGGEHLGGAAYSDGRSAAWEYVPPPSQAAHALSRMTLADGTVHVFSYDAQGRIAGMSRPDGTPQVHYAYAGGGDALVTRGAGTVRAAFDDRGLPCRLTGATGAVFLAEYGLFEKLTRLTGPAGQRVEFARDAKGLLTGVTSTAGSRVVLQRGPFGQVTAITDALGRQTSYRYDLAGNPVAMVFPDGSERRFTHDAQGQLTRLTNRRGQGVTFTYDTKGRPLSATLQSRRSASATYTSRGTYASIADRFGTSTFTYDSQGWLTRTDMPGGRWLTFTHDSFGRRTSAVDESGFTLRYTYDSESRLLAVADSAGTPFVSYAYDAVGRLAQETRGNGTTCGYTYGADGRLLSIVHQAADRSVLSQFAYQYDDVGQVIQAITPEGVWTYQYEPGGRLARAALVGSGATPSTVLTYAYDAAGNCIGRDLDGTAESRTANTLNQIVQAGASIYTYDADGNLVGEGDGAAAKTWAYDELGRLTGGTTAAGTWTHELDGRGRSGAVDGPSGRRLFVHDPQRGQLPWAEYDNAGALQARYVNGIGLVCRIATDGAVHYYDFERTGSTVGLSGPGGIGYLNRYAYLPFGEASVVQESAANRFRFVGRWGVTWHDSGLYHMDLRWYHPGLGRFTSPDPLGQSADLNLYRYAANNPLRFIDPTGAEPYEVQLSTFLKAKDAVMSIVHHEATRLYGTCEELIKAQEQMNPAFDGAAARHEVDRLRRSQAIGENAFEKYVEGLKELGKGGGGGDDDGGITASLIGVKDWLVENYNEIEGFRWIGAEVFEYRMRNTGSILYRYASNLETASWDRLIGELRQEWNWQDEQPVASRDPNAKTGPAGAGVANYIAAGRLLAYRIDFENDATAGAPAQYVAIRDSLSPDLDWSTFEVTEIGFGDQVIAVPAQRQSYATTVNLTYLGVEIEVQVDVRIDPGSGEIAANFYTLDPSTGLPPPVAIGFLPAEDGSGRGQGYFSYVVRPRAGLATGTAIRNVATITFDFGEVIATNQRDPHDPTQGTDPTKEALVTLDTGAPSSAVAALPALSLPGFRVSWSGTDTGAGIAAYTIYVQDNGGPFTAWLSATALTESAYPGVPGHMYGFYSIASDAVGLQEPAKTVAAATTTVPYTVAFAPGPDGALTGSATQYVAAGGSTSAVEAVPDSGYIFRRWRTPGGSVYSTANPLTVPTVNADMSLTAEFEVAGAVAPIGLFQAQVDAAAVAAGRGLWDLTGIYTTTVGSHGLTLNVTHDTRGKLTGTATLRVNTGKELVPLTMPIKGSARGAGGVLLATLSLQGAVAAKAVGAALTFNLTLNAVARQLYGPLAGSLTVNGVPTTLSENVTLNLPTGMTGTWTLQLALARDGRIVSGTALLVLSNGAGCHFTVRGKPSSQGTILNLAGHPADPSAKSIRIRTTVVTLEGGQARLDVFSANAYGQAPQW